VDLYSSSYSNYEWEVYRELRIETYGKDLGQTSWVTTDESNEIPRLLELSSSSHVLEIDCGSGRYTLEIGGTAGCRVLGVDINEPGIGNANQLARNLSGRVRFEHCDCSQKLPFGDATFDAVFSNDVLCHIPGRQSLLREIFRVIKSGGRMLFSDALIIGGLISEQEIATRSSIGHYIFSPPGENERLIEQAGFLLIRLTDTTENAATIAERRRAAREKRKAALIETEGQANFQGVQEFLSMVHQLNSERRLLRFVYVAQKPAQSENEAPG
jgi:SAM-dependent methyltransferase